MKSQRGYTVEVPDLPGCITEGDAVEEALNMAGVAREGFLEVLKQDGESIPHPAKLEVIAKKQSRAKTNPMFATVNVAA